MNVSDDGALIGGRYLLGELLGTGGSASVFAAEDADGGTVAVKLLHPHLCADDAAREAFLREAERASGLDHPTIVRVHGAGLHDAGGVTMPWIALDLLDGPTLREWVEQIGPLGVHDAAAVVDGVLAGLAHAHAQGLIHRDLTPQNVVLAGAGDLRGGAALTADMVRIVDFGLADATGRAAVGGDILLAGGGESVVGSAAFLSPEHAQGLPVRAPSDLYQAGCLLYFALTGEVPFPRATTEQLLQAHVNAPPPVPSSLVPAARPLDRLVTRALAKTPARRFRGADDFREALAAAVPAVAATEAIPPWTEDEGRRELDDTGDADEPATRILPAASDGSLAYLDSGEQDPAPAPERKGASPLSAILAGVAILAVIGVGVAAASTGGASAGTPPTPTPSATATATPTPTPTPTPTQTVPAPVETSAAPAPVDTPDPEPQLVAVPALSGSQADAEAALRAAGLTLGAVSQVESEQPAGRVLRQYPLADAMVQPGSRVDLTVASGANTVPQVEGMTIAAATALLETHGFEAAAQPLDADPTRVVASTQPGVGAVMRLGVTVVLIPQPEPTPTPTPGEGSP